MKKYSKKVIYDYVMGNDIDNFDIDELENDYDFMLEVIKLSNDKKMYNLCSEEIKHEFKFVRGLIEHFKSDIDFIIQVANEFIQNSSDELSNMEMNILVSKCYKDDRDERFIPFLLEMEVFYSKKRAEYQIIVNQEKEQEWKNNWAMGFWIATTEYQNRPIIKEFIAKKMLEEIFDEEKNGNLESHLHDRYKNVQTVLNIGAKDYILSYVMGYDGCLSGYLTAHPDLIKSMITKINKIIGNWDRYNENHKDDLKDAILDEIYDFAAYDKTHHFSETDLIYYIAKELNMNELLEEEQYDDDVYLMPLEEYYNVVFSNCNLKEESALRRLKKRIQELSEGKRLEETKPKISKLEEKNKAKVLKFPTLKKDSN